LIFLLSKVPRLKGRGSKEIGATLQNAIANPSFRLVVRYWESANRYMVYTLLAVTPLFAGVVREDIGVLSGIAATAVLVSLLFPIKKVDFLQRFLLTIAACVLLAAVNANYLAVELKGQTYYIQKFYNGFFVFLGCSTALNFLVMLPKRRIDVTPTDFLLLSIPMLLILVPEPWHTEYRIGPTSARALVLFVALRTLMFRHRDVFRRIKIITLISLAYIAMTSLLGFRIVY